jgi:cytochrome oxidase assembly protein ShyY1
MLSRRWLSALAVATLFAVACLFLGRWQWHRHEDKAARAQRITSHYFASPVPLSRAMPGPDTKLPRAQEWTPVTATGRYAAQSLMLVRNRSNNAVSGYEVVVPLTLADGASLLVDRGWIPNGQSATEPPAVPATPVGDITVTGWLRVGEPSLGRPQRTGQLASINLAEAQAQTGTPLYGAYLILRAETRSPGEGGLSGEQVVRPQQLEKPDTGEGPHLAYALQWWLAAPVGFALVLVGARREHLERWESTASTAPADGRVAGPPKPPKAKRTRIWDEEDE